tara:strand:+ start:803 stop:1015 length:213 start_codon:yes stop_codon:yes gene_type:complete
MRGVFLPLIYWCLKMGENGGFRMLHLVGFHTDVKTPLYPNFLTPALDAIILRIYSNGHICAGELKHSGMI